VAHRLLDVSGTVRQPGLRPHRDREGRLTSRRAPRGRPPHHQLTDPLRRAPRRPPARGLSRATRSRSTWSPESEPCPLSSDPAAGERDLRRRHGWRSTEAGQGRWVASPARCSPRDQRRPPPSVHPAADRPGADRPLPRLHRQPHRAHHGRQAAEPDLDGDDGPTRPPTGRRWSSAAGTCTVLPEVVATSGRHVPSTLPRRVTENA
jgi:hypothetical protein